MNAAYHGPKRKHVGWLIELRAQVGFGAASIVVTVKHAKNILARLEPDCVLNISDLDRINHGHPILFIMAVDDNVVWLDVEADDISVVHLGKILLALRIHLLTSETTLPGASSKKS